MGASHQSTGWLWMVYEKKSNNESRASYIQAIEMPWFLYQIIFHIKTGLNVSYAIYVLVIPIFRY